jgi:hypothetical protein
MPTSHVFRENSPKILQNGEKFVKKDAKNKNSPVAAQPRIFKHLRKNPGIIYGQICQPCYYKYVYIILDISLVV